MKSLAEALQALSIAVTSPRGMARVTVSGGGTSVVVRGRGVTAIGEADIAAEVAAAWRRALVRRLKATELLQEQWRGNESRAPSPELVERARLRRLALDGVDVTATSPRGLAKARRKGDLDVALALRPGALDFLDDDELGAEITAAVRAVDGARTLARRAALAAVSEVDRPHPPPPGR
ncbi:hypothetical protein AB0I28_19910 [Phytomonospora sp. NPDC050363]|uniref:hypothetical protein n=1 Tax=Phytomonospora sp. NPDC050363 TaxID=3155642 RepID=UPI0033F52C73